MKQLIADVRERVSGMLHSSVRNYATPGLTSFLVGGGGRGCVRLFTSDRATREWVTPHSHRFNFTCLVLRGSVENILFERLPWETEATNRYALGRVRPIDGGLGRYETIREDGWAWYIEKSTTYQVGDTYSMEAEQIHSIRFSRKAEVLFFEGPEVAAESFFLEPYGDGKAVPTFEARPWMFELEVSP